MFYRCGESADNYLYQNFVSTGGVLTGKPLVLASNVQIQGDFPEASVVYCTVGGEFKMSVPMDQFE
jgi:hypothetical protein